uniref:3-hydroxyacyl-CoA dehydrogenase NAD binding domain-containing protein n=1 Tax=Magallana gigas TaxID=29159 RepID=A0A8W8J5J0_MAGGI
MISTVSRNGGQKAEQQVGIVGKLLREKLTVKEQRLLITGTNDLAECVKDAFFIQECVYEDLDLKRGVHGKIDDLCKDDVIIASAASALIPSLISQNLRHKNRFIVCHPEGVMSVEDIDKVMSEGLGRRYAPGNSLRNYDNPCQFFSPYKIMETCPAQFVAHGIPCTCPFNPNTIDLPPSVFVVPHIDPKWSPVLTGKFRVKVEMIHGGDIVGCFEIELDTKHHHSGGGFLFR